MNALNYEEAGQSCKGQQSEIEIYHKYDLPNPFARYELVALGSMQLDESQEV